MKLAIVLSTLLTMAFGRSAWQTYIGNENARGNSLPAADDFQFNYFSDYNAKGLMTINGTIIKKWAEGKEPKTGASVRICFAYRHSNATTVNTNGWESVAFYSAAWGSSEWVVKFTKTGRFNFNHCAAAGSASKMINNDVW
jgi:hypothetical protein